VREVASISTRASVPVTQARVARELSRCTSAAPGLRIVPEYHRRCPSTPVKAASTIATMRDGGPSNIDANETG